jgi:hypothetical protein
MPPYADVSDAILDPALSHSFTVTQRPEVVVNGRSTVPNPVITTGVPGVVCASSKNDLERLPDEDRTGRHITIVTQFRLRGTAQAAGKNYKPDLIQWPEGVGSDTFIVKTVDPYPQYGPGFVQAIAASVDMQDQPTPS